MHEIGQLKIQVERLQGKNRALMEEQVDTIEKERVSIEKQFHTQTKHIKEELEKQGIEVGRLKGQIVQFQRTGNFNKMHLFCKAPIVDLSRICFGFNLCHISYSIFHLT